MVSAERVMAYGKLESEASLETRPPSEMPPSDWPKKGGITVGNLSYRHSDTGPFVLKGLNFKIMPGEKVYHGCKPIINYLFITCHTKLSWSFKLLFCKLGSYTYN